MLLMKMSREISVLLALLDWRLYCIGVFLYVIVFYLRVFFSGLPPGPIPLPLVGNLPQLGTQLHLSLSKLGHIYEDVFTVYLGNQPVVILNSHEAVSEAFIKNKHITSARPKGFLFSTATRNNKTIAFADGSNWKQNRNFATKVLRKLGVGKQVLEHSILKEASTLVAALRSEGGKPFDPNQYINLAVSNVICGLLYNKRYEYNDGEFVEAVKEIGVAAASLLKATPINSYPWMRFIPGDLFSYSRFKKALKKIDMWNAKQIEEKRESYDAAVPNVINDLVCHYFQETDKLGIKEDTGPPSDIDLLGVIFDLFAAGAETAGNTLLWCFIYLLHFPNNQDKIQKEIGSVIGRHRPPCWRDKNEMPFTEAFINEVMRICTVVPLSLTHTSTDNFELCGHTIPAGTWMMPNTYSIHRAEKYWTNPQEFNPERFLGKSKTEFFIPFSTGPRVCLGESLAKMEMFVLLTTLLQQFVIEPSDKGHLPSLQGVLGITLGPEKFSIKLKVRC